MLMSPMGLRSEKGCAGDARQKLKSTDPTSRQRGRPTSTNPKLSTNNQSENGKNWSRVPDGCLTPRQTGQQTIGCNITFSLTLNSEAVWVPLPWLCRKRPQKWNPVPDGTTGSSRLGVLNLREIYCCESHRTRTCWVCSRGPTAIVNYRPVLWSERADCINKPPTAIKISSWAPHEFLTWRQTNWMTISHNMTLGRSSLCEDNALSHT
jgi:hypothetical protein